MFSRSCCSSIPAERNHLRLFATTASPVTADNELIERNENALNAISIGRVPPVLSVRDGHLSIMNEVTTYQNM